MRADSKVSLIFLSLASFLSIITLFMAYFWSLPQVIPSFIPAMSILVLVWERFLDLSNKRLKYVYENVLKELYMKCYSQKTESERGILTFFTYSDSIQKLVDMLKRIGTFLILIKLYPSNTIGSLRKTCVYAEKYNVKIRELHRFAQDRNTTFSTPVLSHLLGFVKLDIDKEPARRFKETREFHEILQKEREELVRDLTLYWRKSNTVKVMEEVLSGLKKFMEENSLSVPTKERSTFA